LPDACCSVGARPDAAAIDAALRSGTTTREVARLFGTEERPLSQSSVVRHRPHIIVETSAPESQAPEPGRRIQVQFPKIGRAHGDLAMAVVLACVEVPIGEPDDDDGRIVGAGRRRWG
jgi:hypothetical protein